MPGRNNKKGGKKPEPEPEIESDEGEDEGVELTPDIQQRLMKLMDPEFAEKFIMGLEDGVRNRVRALQGIQKEINDIRDKYLAEHKELEKRYESLAEPIFQQRVAIVTGKKEVTDEEAQKGQGEFVAKANASTTPANVPGIPEFWLTVMKHNDDLNDTITERDEECLKFLEDITCKTFDDPDKGFILEFHFAENPFFTNKLLVKTYHLLEEEDLMLDKAEGCEIDWKPGKNLTVVIKKKKQKSKGAKNVRTVTKEEPCESFFNFFSPPQIPDDMDEEEEDELMEGGLEQQVEADYEIGRILKETVIPRAVLWYTGEAIPVDSDSDEGENEK